MRNEKNQEKRIFSLFNLQRNWIDCLITKKNPANSAEFTHRFFQDVFSTHPLLKFHVHLAHFELLAHPLSPYSPKIWQCRINLSVDCRWKSKKKLRDLANLHFSNGLKSSACCDSMWRPSGPLVMASLRTTKELKFSVVFPIHDSDLCCTQEDESSPQKI